MTNPTRSFAGDRPATPYPRGIVPLTSLRFFAALWVVVLHYTSWLPDPAVERWPIIANGRMAVDFFFMLSGFILTHAHLSQLRERRLSTRPFLVKRIAKVYPMHLATLLFYLVLITALGLVGMQTPNPERYDAGQFVLNLFLVHAWQAHDAGAWNYPSWSVSAEWFAYLLFPLIAPVVVRRWRAVDPALLVAGALALLVAVWTLSKPVLGTSMTSLHSNFGYVRIVPEFLLGMALYRLGNERDIGRLGHRLALPGCAAVIVVLAAFDLQLLVLLASAVLILVAAEAARQGRRTVLDRRVPEFLGQSSYSLYMVHLPVATVLFQLSDMALGAVPVWLLPVAIAVAVAVAIAAYVWLEEPARKFVQRFAAPRGTTDARPPSGPTGAGRSTTA